MNTPTKVLLVQWRPDQGRLRQGLARELSIDTEWRRVFSENELRLAAADLAPTVVVCADDMPKGSPRAVLDAISVLAQQPPHILVCEVCQDSAPWSSAAADSERGGFGPAIEDLMQSAKLRAAQTPPPTVSPGRPPLPAILRASLDAVLMLDERGWVTDLNAHAQRLLGIGANRRPKTQAHLQDLIVALQAAGEGRCTSLPLVALNLEGLLLLNAEPGQRLGDAALDVIASVVQPQFARCGLLARIAAKQYLAVVPHMSPAADAAVAVGGLKRAHAERDLASMFGTDSVNDAHIKNPPAPPRTAVPRLAADLTAAIERHALAVDFQPQYELANGRGCGAEALVRWPLSSGDTLSPDRFIPMAERSGSIAALDTWVLKTACASALTWRGPGADRITLAVNVSDRDLNADYPRILAEVLRTCRFPAHRLELEIGEDPLVANSGTVHDCLRQCKELGVRIAVSHRSGNYSTLKYLALRAVDRLKLDKSLIRRMTDDPGVAASVRAIIALCAEFKVDVMAEGVETPAQLQMLREFDCPRVQGFLLARPMPAVQAQVVLRKQWGNLPAGRVQPQFAVAH